MNRKETECIDCEKRSACFNKLSKADFRLIEESRVELRFRRGEIICKQGSFASNIMFVYSGIAKTYLETRDGAQVILNILPEGRMIGLPALFTDRVFPYTAAALEDCIICSVDIRIFEEFTQANGSFACELIHMLNTCTINNYERLTSLTHKQLDGRFADALLFLSDVVYSSKRFRNSLSRIDMANLTGMSPESVTRMLNKFTKEGLITTSGRTLEILDEKRLKWISDIG